MRQARCRRRRVSWTRWIPFTAAFQPTVRSTNTWRRIAILLAEEARRWIKEDVPAGSTPKAHLAIARRLFRPIDRLVSEVERFDPQ